ncbi:MAG: ComF family protein [Desulfobacter sp.]|nr:MAG: ComF family protein [Desulfobacter sp.]
MAGRLAAFVFPDKCVKCKRYMTRGRLIPLSACYCPQCLDPPLPFFTPPFCTCCGHVFSGKEGSNHFCESCLKTKLPLDRVRAAFETHFSQTHIDYIIPIPLYKKKVRKRGFNQSYLLVRHFILLYLETYKNLPPWQLDIHSLVRVKQTPSQTGLDIRQRQKNLTRAFDCREKRKFKGKSILLCDDVFTSGATCSAAAKCLISAGAARVFALVLARA